MSEREENSEVVAIQQNLRNLGFDIKVDGDLGPKTREALEIYQRILENKPLEPIPWWRSSSMRSGLVAVIGGLALFIPTVKEILTTVDIHQVINILFNLSSHVEELIQGIGMLLAIFGVGGLAKGRINATHPIDPRQVTSNIRLPFDVVSTKQLRNSNSELSTENGEFGDGYWSNYRGPFDDGH